ncbi:DNA-binding transcriptional regulator, LysR family [Faunimonas pinastri]|uniref:DNA-binding transcriptional regulator, LysR family n=1 Tax=Faunimonas pinastri TaxID=1855383 RepID=A0A1H9B683_9HYPH|nr:LysR family transcriptional regulator [Faunimonas pinastri]SEP84454.1 DNA-binding transcriptional regulator, LysR family [Faunimonas pinastri]
MNLEALRYFVAVAEAGSIREAAENLHVAQSALSRQIQNLEQAFGAPLLSRLPRGVETTPAGRIFLRRARDSLAAVALARDEIAALQGLSTGEVRIASIEPFADDLLPDLITRFREKHPGITFDVRVGNTRQVVGLVQEGVVEIGIGYNPPPDPALRVLTSLTQPLVALVSPHHSFAGCEEIRFADLAGQPLVLAPAGSPTRQVIEAAAARAGIRLRVVVESDSVPLRLGLAERASLIAILAELSGRAAAERGRLVSLRFSDALLQESEVQIISLKDRARSRAVIDFERGLYGAIRRMNGSRDASGEA